MGLEYKMRWNVKKGYKDLIQKEKYELVLLDVMNSSQIVFPKTYKHIEEQSDGESDYITTDGDEYQDAKVLFYQEQCKAIKCDEINAFFNELLAEINEIYELVSQGDVERLQETKLFAEMNRRINSIKENEDLILFFPFAITDENSKSLTGNCGNDIFSHIIYKIREKFPSKVNNMKIYMIYPNFENEIVLKEYEQDNMKIEFLRKNFLKKYIEC